MDETENKDNKIGRSKKSIIISPANSIKKDFNTFSDLNFKNNLTIRLNFLDDKPKNKISDKTENDHKKAELNVLNNFLNKASNFIGNTSNGEEEEEEEDEEVTGDQQNRKKIEFNEVVEEMAQYYIQEDNISCFYFSQFMETVFIHFLYFIFGPLIVPVLIKIYGRNFIRNMGLWGKKVGRSHLLQIFYWICFITTLALTIITVTYNKLYYNQHVFLSPAYIAQIMVLIRYITVCVKYGFFPKKYYKKWKQKRLTRTEVKSNYLINGWIKPSLLVLDIYLREILQKYNIDPDNFIFQCVGKVPNSMVKSLIDVDRLINEDALKIRRSIFRRLKKRNIFLNSIRDNIKFFTHRNKTAIEEKANEKYNCKDFELETKSNSYIFPGKFFELHQIGEENEENKKNNNNFIISSNNFINDKEKIKVSAKERLKNFIINRILPQVRIQLKNKCKVKEVKIKYKNDYQYEINGIYLLRVILKDVFTLKLQSYGTIHKILVFIICQIPITFTFIYFHIFNLKIQKENESSTLIYNNMTMENSTTIYQSNNTRGLNLNETITFNYFSLILLIFSCFSMIPPVWLNTLNLLYGVVDLIRKNELMENITEMINTQIKPEKRDYPLFNILHGNTMLNWYYLRNICISFGQRFSDRIILQASVFCLFIVVAIIFSAFSILNLLENMLALVNYLLNF